MVVKTKRRAVLTKAGLLLLVLWLIGLSGLYQIGDAFHMLLLIGLLLLLLAFARARDEALRPPSTDKR
jgi:hypothetical protein